MINVSFYVVLLDPGMELILSLVISNPTDSFLSACGIHEWILLRMAMRHAEICFDIY